jgi:Skp family chaperone for outer membrane proteins
MSIDEYNDTEDFINDINSRLDSEEEEESEGKEQHHNQAGDNDDNNSDNNERQKHKVRLYRIAEQIHQKEDIFVDQYRAPYAFVKIHDPS